MISLNRGEWSELYVVLFLLIEPKLEIVDEKLNTIEKGIFEIRKIILNANDKLEYCIEKNSVYVYMNFIEYNKMSINEVNEICKKIYKGIINNNKTSGAFSIIGVDTFLGKFSNGEIIKGKSIQKEDIETIVFDNKKLKDVNLKYSIKSLLGRPATLLNSSQHTNFRYSVTNISKEDIKVINSINTRTKLLDRMAEIEEKDGIILFDKVVSPTFDYNLRMVDSNMPEYLGNMLLSSYANNEKDLKELFLHHIPKIDKNFAIKKLEDLLSAICFSFIPSEKWGGHQSVNGGFLIVNTDGKILVLDLVYYKQHVLNYLVNNTKLDSPSSTRYHMFELYEENGRVYFTLNLQIRYKNL
ncbi:MAG: HpaII family restriction endonuclease [Eubacteriales bacterium]|nr:HpaII family restriction endonuclease [Eubacteriales bacterium]